MAIKSNLQQEYTAAEATGSSKIQEEKPAMYESNSSSEQHNIKQRLGEAVRKPTLAAKQKIQDVAGPAGEKLDSALRESIQRYPLQTILAAAATGYILGRGIRGIHLPWAQIANLGLSNLDLLRSPSQSAN